MHQPFCVKQSKNFQRLGSQVGQHIACLKGTPEDTLVVLNFRGSLLLSQD